MANTLTAAEVLAKLKAHLAPYGAQAEAARTTGLSRATISRVLAGHQSPPEALLALVGVEYRSGYVPVAGEPE